MPEQKFYLEELGANAIASLDSGMTKADGSFSIKGKGTEEALYRVRFAMGKYIMLVLKNEAATIAGDWNNLEEYHIDGSQGSQTLKVFLTALREHIRDVNSLDYVTKQLSQKGGNKDSMMQGVQDDLSRMNKEFVSYVKQFSDGEILPLFTESVRNQDVYFIQSLISSDAIMETLLVSIEDSSNTRTFASAPSMAAIRASKIPCASFAASYSAFSFKSPFSRASAIALLAAGRSTALIRCKTAFICSSVCCDTY